MFPLSCANCCHNPLQVGNVGYSIGYCTRFHQTLTAPNQTTCGALQRRDLQREHAEAERKTHARTFSTTQVSDLATRASSSRASASPHPVEQGDAVLEQVRGYGQIEKIGTLAALNAMPGVRAEVALSNLGRSYFANCVRRDGPWTAGLHLAWWTLGRLTSEPRPEIRDLRDDEGSLDSRWELGRWYIVSARLLLLFDVANRAHGQPKANGMPRLSRLIDSAFERVPAGDGTRLIRFLRRHQAALDSALPEAHYRRLAADLHREPEDPLPAPAA